MNTDKAAICIGPPLISILAKEGQWVGSDGHGVVAADELFRQDPYEKIIQLERELNEAKAELAYLRATSHGTLNLHRQTPTRMLIALDFDKTYTLHPLMWNNIVWEFKGSGFSVIMVTARSAQHENSDLYRAVKFSGISEVYFTDGQPKKQYLAALNLHPNVWIDDDPASIDPLGRLQPCNPSTL